MKAKVRGGNFQQNAGSIMITNMNTDAGFLGVYNLANQLCNLAQITSSVLAQFSHLRV